jgi:hypothetical protein
MMKCAQKVHLFFENFLLKYIVEEVLFVGIFFFDFFCFVAVTLELVNHCFNSHQLDTHPRIRFKRERLVGRSNNLLIL